MAKKLFILLVVVLVGIATVFIFGANNSPAPVSSTEELFVIGEQTDTEVIVIGKVVLERSGFVVVREVINEKPGQIIEVSDYLEIGTHESVVIDLQGTDIQTGIDISAEFPLTRELAAVVYVDDGDKDFNPNLDIPAYANGDVVARLISTGEVVSESSVVPGDSVSSQEDVAVIVTYTDNGFIPSSVEIQVGETVRFINESSRLMWVASDIHPAHNILPTFDQFRVSGFGESYEYTFDQQGTWKYHDHVNASKVGTIIVR